AVVLFGLTATVTAALARSRPADATPVRIALSSDGLHWADRLPRPLFEPDIRWIPGDSRSRSFFVRNETAGPAVLTVVATTGANGTPLPKEDGILTVVRLGSLGGHVGRAGGDVTRLTLAARDVEEIDVTTSFDPASTNSWQDRQLALDIAVTLADASPLTR